MGTEEEATPAIQAEKKVKKRSAQIKKKRARLAKKTKDATLTEMERHQYRKVKPAIGASSVANQQSLYW